MLIEIHMLKNYPPVNLNRDDSGAPKTCFFGGVQRGRISSQCMKRSWRMAETFRSLGSVGTRTRRMPEQIAERLKARGVDDAFAERAKTMLTGIVNKGGTENAKGAYTEQIVIYAPADLDKLTDAVLKAIEEDGDIKKFKARKAGDFKKLVDGAAMRPVTADIALFGRMVTSECFRDVDASIQVAHAISTHAVSRESDYFTAVDDLLREDEVGVGMMGDVDFNSCCYYEYASLDVDQLRQNLKYTEDCDALVEKLVPTLIRTMCLTNPSGKQNTFAGQILPSMVMVECKREKIPLSYVNAFEKPVPVFGRQGIVDKSVEKLCEHVKAMDDAYGLSIQHRAWMAPQGPTDAPFDGKRLPSLQGLLDEVSGWLKEAEA